jgi:hypothetical protein
MQIFLLSSPPRIQNILADLRRNRRSKYAQIDEENLKIEFRESVALH